MALIDQRCNKSGKCPFQMVVQGTLICSLVDSRCNQLVDVDYKLQSKENLAIVEELISEYDNK